MNSRRLSLMNRLTASPRLSLVGLLLRAAVGLSSANAAETPPEQIAFFESKIRPILVTHCYECHSVEKKETNGGLTVDSREALLKGGDSGPALVPGNPDQSLLIIAVRQSDKDLRMPPKQKLSSTQIADLEAWVKLGAPDPRAAVTSKLASSSTTAKYGVSLEEGRKFWSFQPVKDPPLPSVKNSAWPRNSIDSFILARLEAAGVAPASQADPRTLLRRVTFDLTGLPPTPEEMDDFLKDKSPQAFAKVVDRLLASPRYGERWGRHWLDVVRYADTCGNASDYPVPQAYKYRDWVIQAINRDLPYDQFLREQLAGDLLPSANDAERSERIVATGYLAIARRFGGSRMGEHHLTLEDTIDNVGRAMLGASISCARCHDHKFDPFTMSDYYGLYGVFASTRYPFPGAEVGKQQEDFVPLISAAEIEALMRPYREQLAAVEAEVKQLEMGEAEAKKLPESPEKATRLAEATKALAEGRKRRTELQATAPIIDDAYAVADAKASNARVQLRGDPKRLGDEVPRHFPAILGGQEVPKDSATSGRLQLAEWLTDPRNPLTARVMVNRIWQHHFGKGLVQTPNDFGHRGAPPTHPELLDFLAARFVESGWSLKSMHRMILLSQIWQLASGETEVAKQLDPNNDLYGRFARRRLDAESIRDAILFVSGDLDESAAGPHPFPAASKWNWTQHNPFYAVYESRHRSVYLMQQRMRKNSYLALFDGADPSSSTGVRLPSTTPLQALFMMNDPLAYNQASKFAARMIAAASAESARIDLAYRTALGRSPDSDEMQECTVFLQKYREKLTGLKTPADQVEPQAWAALARALLSGNEFVFLD
jgi:hypothetical protein